MSAPLPKTTEWVLEEIRALHPFTRALQKKERARLAKWQKYGSSKRKALHKFLEKCIVEMKFKNVPTVFRFVIHPDFIFDKGSVPSFIPDLLAEDEGWLGQLLMYAIHDGLYATKRYSRLLSDFVPLNEGFRVVGVGNGERRRVYYSVRAFGWWPWRKPSYVVESNRVVFKVEENDKFTLMPHNVPDDANRVFIWRG